eukprot:CAMPEP_0168241116 /NCGR_PEP_ID=MMETSP0140_2-20121125/22610_1 /TAXON_ID=44445 /ORGANISM="Pseudo-nitzschia australis, Strain 10249 10 AB" /LENGTH=568 /DNA_ID=CAMNT_0008175919 /DNA_START=119 /DNA_END=1825 /DNA_ORIENTATION=-
MDSSSSNPAAGLPRPSNNARGNGLAVPQTAPMIDATIIGKSHERRPSKARIEGMDKLSIDKDNSDYANLTEAERQMREEELSFYSASDNDHGDDNIWGLLSGVGGNIYEWYDFAVYGLLASEIGACFFPQSSKELQLVNSFGVSILLITIPSVLMGILPGYETFGWISPILLVLLRMLQGLSVGGQLAGSYVLSIEQSSPRNRGFRGSICDASSVGGFLLASLVTTSVRFSCTKEQVDAWAWRLPFLFSLLLAPILYHVVSQTEESKFWSERNEQKEIEEQVREAEADIDGHSKPAIMDLLESPFRRRQLAGMIGLLSATTSTFYVLFLFCPVYLSELKGLMTQAHADSMNVAVVGTYIVLLILSGQFSDRFPHRRDLMCIGLPGLIVACPIMFGLFETESWWGIFVGQVLLAVCLAMVNGGMAALEVEMWMADPTMSFTGVAVGHNTAATLFGGTMPLVATGLYYKSITLVNPDEMYPTFFNTLVPQMLPGFYISFLGMISLFCVSYIVKHPHDVRTGSPRLKAAVLEENRKFKQKNLQAKKRKKNLEAQLEKYSDDNVDYLPPSIT